MNFEKLSLNAKPQTPEASNNYELKNTAKLSTENADYLLYYTRHDVQTSPEIVNRSDALILESITDFRDDKKTKKSVEHALFDKTSPYHEAVRAAAEQGKPIFLLDLSRATAKSQNMLETKNGEDQDEMSKNELKVAIEGSLGLGAIMWAAVDLKRMITDNPKMSRRNFLKFLGKSATGLALTSPLIGRMTGYISTKGTGLEPDESSVSRKAQKVFEDATYRTNLDRSKTIHTRNDLWAQKSEKVAKYLQAELGRKPSLALSMGADHVGIERSIKENDETRLARLSKELGDDFKNEGLIAKIDLTPEAGSDRVKVEVVIIHDENFQ